MSSIFFIRHENDFNFMLPLIVNDPKAFLVLYGEIGLDEINQIKLNNLNYLNIYSKFKYLNLLHRLINKLSLGIFQRKLASIFNILLVSYLNHNINININNIPFKDCSSIVFDHTSSDFSTALINEIKSYRNYNNLKFKLISAPHGIGMFLNSMTDYIYTKPVFHTGFNIYDIIVCNDQVHFDTFIKSGVNAEKLITIPSLRYSQEWVANLLKQSKSIKRYENKTNILIIHSKFMGNINSNEIERCLKILTNFSKFNIRIKSHPRGGFKEAVKLSNKDNQIQVVVNDVVGNVNWSDYVIFFGSSVVYDAFILNKTVLFPSFATSNQLPDDILSGVHSLNTPDDFYEAFLKISNGDDIGPKYQFNNNFKENLEAWKEILS
jgi:hypothetical protein